MAVQWSWTGFFLLLLLLITIGIFAPTSTSLEQKGHPLPTENRSALCKCLELAQDPTKKAKKVIYVSLKALYRGVVNSSIKGNAGSENP